MVKNCKDKNYFVTNKKYWILGKQSVFGQNVNLNKNFIFTHLTRLKFVLLTSRKPCSWKINAVLENKRVSLWVFASHNHPHIYEMCRNCNGHGCSVSVRTFININIHFYTSFSE